MFYLPNVFRQLLSSSIPTTLFEDTTIAHISFCNLILIFLPDSILMLSLWSKLNRASGDYIISLPKPFGAFSPYLEWKPKSIQRPTKPYDWGPHNVSSILLFAYWSSSLTCNWLLTLLGMLFSQILAWLTYSFT